MQDLNLRILDPKSSALNQTRANGRLKSLEITSNLLSLVSSSTLGCQGFIQLLGSLPDNSHAFTVPKLVPRVGFEPTVFRF